VPTQTIYWTLGRRRRLNLGKLVIQLEHVPSWQLAFAKEPAGEIVRALAWAGPERVQSVLAQIGGKAPKSELQKVAHPLCWWRLQTLGGLLVSEQPGPLRSGRTQHLPLTSPAPYRP
jgi:hypothetical protein